MSEDPAIEFRSVDEARRFLATGYDPGEGMHFLNSENYLDGADLVCQEEEAVRESSEVVSVLSEEERREEERRATELRIRAFWEQCSVVKDNGKFHAYVYNNNFYLGDTPEEADRVLTKHLNDPSSMLCQTIAAQNSPAR
jgi:hypothetical protein